MNPDFISQFRWLGSGTKMFGFDNFRILKELEMVHKDDLMMNKAMGLNGAIEIKNRVPGKATILTHCNAGALATGGYGTALGRTTLSSANKSNVSLMTGLLSFQA